MARSYHVEIAQHAADADAKWVDNLLSHFNIPGVEGGRQGVARRISLHGIYHVALIRRLTRGLTVSVDAAVSLARHLLTTDAEHLSLSGGLSLHLDRRVFEREVDAALAVAVESVAPARRGRPPLRR
ncbi:MAG: hypothetical protein JWM41_3743 [Gemmatimonadetes bacterium]|nr:hypothetical protein [Gemmatimonadota bacterium]